jgi:energy-coupling factor transporter ATP-binding protein EcfA2
MQRTLSHPDVLSSCLVHAWWELMAASIDIFWGDEPLERSELQFLAALQADLDRGGVSALVLANFYTGRGARQVDFLIVTDARVCHVELKGYRGILVGGTNGPWSIQDEDGSLRLIERQNPYMQAATCTFAISDDMHDLVATGLPGPVREKFYKHIDTVVVVFPTLDPKSQVPSDYRVSTLGYPAFVQLLLSAGDPAPWTRRHWGEFIRARSLTNAKASIGDAGLSFEDRALEVEDYLRRYRDFYSAGLPPLVPLSLVADGNDILHDEVVGLTRDAGMVLLVGQSGSGKSHLARHSTLAMSDELVPVWVAVRSYDGRLSTLLNRSIARFSTNTFTQLEEAMRRTGRRLLIVLDGLNECPEAMREQFAGDVRALDLRLDPLVLVTSQSMPSPPLRTGAITVQTTALSSDQRVALLTSYGAPTIESKCDPFSNAYELAIAAECAVEIDGAPTRAKLFAAFLRRRLRDRSTPAICRQALRRIASTMGHRLVVSLPVDDAVRVIERYLNDIEAPIGVLDDVMRCSVLDVSDGRVAFSHELLGRFLVAEELSLASAAATELAAQLSLPRNHDLTALAIELEDDLPRLAHLLDAMHDRHLYATALMGAAGELASRASAAAARRVTRTVVHDLDRAEYRFLGEGLQLEVANGTELSPADIAVLGALGTLAPRGLSLGLVVEVIDATDRACRRSVAVQQQREGTRPPPSIVVSCTLRGFGSHTKVPAAVVLDAVNHAGMDKWYRHNSAEDQVAVENLAEILAATTDQTYGRLLLLCHLLRSTNDPAVSALLPEFLRLCLASEAYHIQLDGLDTVRWYSQAVEGGPIRDDIIGQLLEFEPKHIFISSQLVETMYSFGLIEDQDDHGFVSDAIQAIIQSPRTQISSNAAYGIYGSQFEDPIAAPYWAAIEELDSAAKAQLLTIAAFADETSTFFMDTLLRDLIQLEDPSTLPAFERWATRLVVGPGVQETAANYRVGIKGWAQHVAEPPKLAEPKNDASRAWEILGEILFWSYRAETHRVDPTRNYAANWAKLRAEALPAAADALFWITGSDHYREPDELPLIKRMIETGRTDVRLICEWSLDHEDQLISLFPHPHAFFDRTGFIIQVLGEVGTAASADLLRPLVDDRQHGRAAIAAIRRLGR